MLRSFIGLYPSPQTPICGLSARSLGHKYNLAEEESSFPMWPHKEFSLGTEAVHR